MTDFLNAIYHDDPASFQKLCSLDNPQTVEERQIAVKLRVVEKDAAEALKASIEELADKQAEEGFYTGVRFGAQLMVELLREY